MFINPLNIASFFIISMPFLLVTGPFFSDLGIVIVDIIFIYFLLKNKDFSILKNSLFITLLIFNFYISLRSIFADDFFLSFKSAFPYFRFIFFSFAVLYFLKKQDYLIKYFSSSLVLTVVVLCIDAIIQYVLGYNLIGYTIDNPDKLNGLFGSEAVLGSYLIRLLPLTIVSYFVLFKNKLNTSFHLLLIFFISLVIFLSGSRTSFALLIIFLILYFFLFKNIRKYMLFGILFLTLTVVFASFFNNKVGHSIYYNIKDPIRTIFNEDRAVLRDNLKDKKIIIFTQVYHSHYETAFNMFKHNKIFGVGNKMYRKLCNKDEYFVNDFSCTTHPHNFYLQILAENGLIGFIILASIFFYISYLILREVWQRNINNRSLISDYSIILLVGMFLNLWPIAPSGNIFNNWLSILIYMPLGFYFYFIKLKK